MDIKEFETLILQELKNAVQKILINKPEPNVPVKKGERQGDAISKILEFEFVKQTTVHKYFVNSWASPTDKTKNPFDTETYFEYRNHREKVWIDFKAINIDNIDSNADSGTFKKVIELIKKGDFYLTYIYVYYKDSGNNTIRFEKNSEEDYVKVYFLKDIGDKMHITPSNQIQVNYKAPIIYRTREQFVDFFIEKIKESYLRRSVDSIDMLEKMGRNEIRLGSYKKPKIIKLIKESKRKVIKEKIIIQEVITFDELKKLNKLAEEKINNI